MGSDNPSILIVDDDKALCSLLEYKLLKRGFGVVKAYDGYEALAFMEAKRFDLVLLDLMMPKLDGYQCLRQLAEAKVKKPGAIIVLSARGDEEDILSAFSLGVVDYITKPFSMDVLIARLMAALKFKVDR